MNIKTKPTTKRNITLINQFYYIYQKISPFHNSLEGKEAELGREEGKGSRSARNISP